MTTGLQNNMAGVKGRATRNVHWMQGACPVCRAQAGVRCLGAPTGSVAHQERMALPPRRPVAPARIGDQGSARRIA